MKIKIFLGVTLSMVLLNACSSYEEAPLTQEPVADKPLAVEHVPVEKACSILNGIISSPAVQENATRGVTVSPSNVKAFNADGEMLTRTDNDDARYYLMDIPELEMYAIMGAHTTVPPLMVLANGSANAPEVQEVNELKNYIANLPNTPSNWVIPTDPVVPIDTTKFKLIRVYDYDNATYTLLNGVTPIDMKWGQDYPYNMRYPDGYNDKGQYYQHAFVCCGAMSIAMVMTHPKYRPDITINGHKMDWQRMWNFKYEDYATLYPDRFGDIVENHISELLWTLSTPENLDVDFGQYGSYCWLSDIAPVLSKFGIDCEHPCIPYSLTALESEIGQGYPVIIDGSIVPQKPEDSGSHIWIVSAILKAEVPYELRTNSMVQEPDYGLDPVTGIQEFTLLHHNWGWAKCRREGQEGWDYNGYYLESSKIVSGNDIYFDEDFGFVINRPDGWGTYNNFTIWTGLRKRTNQ